MLKTVFIYSQQLRMSLNEQEVNALSMSEAQGLNSLLRKLLTATFSRYSGVQLYSIVEFKMCSKSFTKMWTLILIFTF